MKRVQSAMLQQTLKFVLSDKLSHSQAVEYSSKEADDYVHQLEKSGLKFSILSRNTDSDGATIIEVKKQYNTAPTGNYI